MTESPSTCAYIAGLCAHDWGLFHDVQANLAHLQTRLAAFGADAEVEDRVRGALSIIERAIETEPKPAAWRLRAKVGTLMPWRNTVEEQGLGHRSLRIEPNGPSRGQTEDCDYGIVWTTFRQPPRTTESGSTYLDPPARIGGYLPDQVDFGGRVRRLQPDPSM